MLLTLSVTRYLDTSAAAAFLLIFNVTTVAAVWFRWGFDDLIVRRVAADTAVKTPRLVPYLMRLAHHRVAIWAALGAAVAVVLGIARPEIAGGISVAELLVAVVISGLLALTACAGRVHQGQHRTNYAAFILNILVPGLLLLGLWALVGLGFVTDSWRLQLIYATISLLTYLGVVWTTPRMHPILFRSPDERWRESAQAKVDRRAANRFGGVVLSQHALHWSALLIVPIAYGDRLFTSFMVTYKVALLIDMVMMAVNFTFASRLAALFAAAEFDELQRLKRIMVVTVAAASGLAAGIVIGLRGFVYSFANVHGIDGILAILVVAQIFFTLSAVYALVLSMCHGEAFLLKAQGGIVISGTAVFVVLCFIAPLEVSVTVFAVTYLTLLLVLRQRALRIVKG